MALNIKNTRTEQLAHEIAKETGESLTQTITTALEERLERLRGRRQLPVLQETLWEIAQRCRQLPDLDLRPPEEILGYDEMGGFGHGD